MAKSSEVLQLLESPSGFPGGAAISGGPDHGSRGDKQGQGGLPESRKRKDERALDKDEEDYFNEDRYALQFFRCLSLVTFRYVLLHLFLRC